jgi:rusticyanin
MKSSKRYVVLLLAGVILLGAYYVWQYSWFISHNRFRGGQQYSNNEQQNRNYGQPYGPGMMGGYRGGGMMRGYQYNYNGQYLDANSSDNEMTGSLKNAAINKKDNSITYSGDNVKIVMFSGAEGFDDKFVIGGLVNPTIYIKEGSTVNLELINKDKDAPHGVEITEAAPPYYSMTMMQGGTYPGSYIPVIQQAADGKYPFVSTSFNASYNGEFHYICQYPGHAANGMYGKIIVQ